MSLFGSIQMAGNTLQAMQIGLHVVGNNIANANTPGYVRERVLYTPAPVQRKGNLTLGLGVEVAGIVQSADRFVLDRLRDAGGDRASADIQEKVYRDLESILGELSDTDISTQLTNFFNSIDEVLKQPEDIAVRNLVVQSGKTLTTSINTLQRRVQTVYTDFSDQVGNLSSEINTLTEEIRKLNLQIVTLEGGSTAASEAGGLRSQRGSALRRLAEIADIKVNETEAGATNVQLAGQFLVFEGTRREVKTDYASNDGLLTATVRFSDDNSALEVGGGELHGYYEARDTITGGFLNTLDGFAGSLAFEFNKVYSQGQGISGFDEVFGTYSVDDAGEALDAAGLPFTPTTGDFDLLVYNTETGLTETHAIHVDLNGIDGDDSLSTLAGKINAVDGVSATITSDNQLHIESVSADNQIAFSGDTSGVLAALGINTFFTGSTAGGLGVNENLLSDGSKFAAADDGVGVGTENAIKLVQLHDTALENLNGNTITGLYDQLINETTQGATVAAAVADGLRVFEGTLEGSAQEVSGVNLDEEAIDMIMLQRTYQASARYIQTLSDLLDILVAL
ncbi:MAG: flagellar hook-associated protein FlgK [Planctomycetaceae bacterium]|nr:flagellar hook-associated protein FlgK [Planctomycetaceae bacterium]